MSAELPPEQRASYAAIIDDILATADLNTISAKRIRKALQEKVDYDLASQKDAITTLIMERFDKVQTQAAASSEPAPEPVPTANGHENGVSDTQSSHASPGKRKASDDDDDDLSSVMDSPPPKKVKKKAPKPQAESDEAFAARLQAEMNAGGRSTRGGGAGKKKAPLKKEKKTKKKSSTKVRASDDSELESGTEKPEKEKKGGFHKLMALSEPLAALVGDNELSRPQTVKRIWAYVKERDLQDPKDKRQLRCDDTMRAVFKQDKVHMFTMNKLLAAHFYPKEEQ